MNSGIVILILTLLSFLSLMLLIFETESKNETRKDLEATGNELTLMEQHYLEELEEKQLHLDILEQLLDLEAKDESHK